MKPTFLLGTCAQTGGKVAFNIEFITKVVADIADTASVYTLDGRKPFHINESVEDFVAAADEL